MTKDLRILVFISGRGSNLKTLISECPKANFIGVISNNPDAAGLRYAESREIATFSFNRSKYQSISDFKSAIRKKAVDLQPDVVVLAGYMQILEPEFIQVFENRIINIHPSLLPAFPGLDTHKRVIAAGADVHGCTVHLVDQGVDTGSIIAQMRVEVVETDTEDSLSQRVLEKEHVLYPWVLNAIVNSEITLGETVSYSSSIKTDATKRSIFLPGARND